MTPTDWRDCSPNSWLEVQSAVLDCLNRAEEKGNRKYHSNILGFQGYPVLRAWWEAIDLLKYLHTDIQKQGESDPTLLAEFERMRRDGE